MNKLISSFIAVIFCSFQATAQINTTPASAQTMPIAIKGATIHCANSKIIKSGVLAFENGKININGTSIEYNSNDADSVIINGKKYPKATADSIIKKDLKNIKELKDIKDLKNLDISIDENGSKIKIKTNK